MKSTSIWMSLFLSIVYLCSATEADHDRAYASACLSLFRASSPSSNSSFVFSPLSLTTALAVLHEGANEVAGKEIANLLLHGSPSTDLAKFYSGLIKNVLNDSGNHNLLMATRIFAGENYKLDKEFATKAEKEFQAGVESVNINDAVGSAKKINAFIASNTGNRIKDVIKAEDFKEAVLFLVNALFFSAAWEEEFYLEANKKRTFHGAAGKRENIDFMTHGGDLFSYQETDSAQVLSIPYEKSSHFTFVIILPKSEHELKEVKQNLNPDTFLGLLNEVKSGSTYIKAVIPKFSLQSSAPAIDALEKLGIHSIFTAGNLKKIANVPGLFVSDVKHETLLKIHENGTDAAAATVDKGGNISGRIYSKWAEFIADRPFLFAIVAEKKYPVFLGQYV